MDYLKFASKYIGYVPKEIYTDIIYINNTYNFEYILHAGSKACVFVITPDIEINIDDSDDEIDWGIDSINIDNCQRHIDHCTIFTPLAYFKKCPHNGQICTLLDRFSKCTINLSNIEKYNRLYMYMYNYNYRNTFTYTISDENIPPRIYPIYKYDILKAHRKLLHDELYNNYT